MEEEEDAPTAEGADAPSPDEERAEKKERAIRWRVLLFVAPLIPTLVIPWKLGFSWEMNERTDTAAFVAVPLLALFATIVALLKKRSLLVRSLILGAVGVALAAIAFDFFTAPRVIHEYARDIRRLDAYALYLGLGVPLFALTMELFAALDRRSRVRAVLAGGGWALLVLGFFLPMRSDRIESMPFLMMTELVDDARHREELLLLAAPLAVLLFLAMGASVLTILRLIGDAEQRERWRPRSGCLAIGIGALPAPFIFLLFVIGAISDDIEWFGTAIDGAAFTLGFWVGLPTLLAAGLDGIATTAHLAIGRGDAKHVRLARIGLAAVLGSGVFTCLTPAATSLLPDGREAAAAEVLLDVSEEVVQSAHADSELDPRFIGGYSEFDLRGSRGVLADAIGDSEAELVYATFEIVVAGRVEATITVGVDPDGDLAFVGGDSFIVGYPPEGMLELASEPLSNLAARIEEGLTSIGCLPASAPPDLPGLVNADPSTLQNVCSPMGGDTSRRRISDIPRSSAVRGGTGAYRVWLRANGDIHLLEGRLYSHEGRLWIGRASIPEG